MDLRFAFRLFCFPALFLLVALLPISAARGQGTATPQPAQSQPAGPNQGPTLTTRPPTERRVTLYVQAADKSGKPVRGLQQQDFTIFDDQQPRQIASFQAVDLQASAASVPPLEIVLVVDAVNTTLLEVDYERDQIRKFLLRNDGKLPWPVSLVIFTEKETRIQNAPSRDGKALAAFYEEYKTGLRSANVDAGGYYHGQQRLDASLKALDSIVSNKKKLPGRKLVLWISPGWPLFHGLDLRLVSRDEEGLFTSVVATSTELRAAGITLYSVDPIGTQEAGKSRTRFYEDYLKPVTSAPSAVPGDLGLQVLATHSGGRVLFDWSHDLAKLIQEAASDADAYYILSFDSLPADHPDEYHSLEVKVDKPKVTARTTTGYYDQR